MSGRQFIIVANSEYVLVSRSVVKVADVKCGVVVSMFVLASRFRDAFGVPPPMWCRCEWVFAFHLCSRRSALFRWAGGGVSAGICVTVEGCCVLCVVSGNNS